jgi:hypothetical protein
MPAKPGEYHVRYVYFDANAWKTRIHGLFRVPEGGRGLTLFGDEPAAHQLYADHMTAETPVKVEANGRAVTEWSIKATKPDNDFLDATVGCGVAASMLGVTLTDQSESRPVRKIKLSELQKMKKAVR